ncbi:MAG: hypothetical protein ACI9HY_001273 [Planctomycetaceae bacterium]|jgi:hypothetical protein
MTTVAHRENLIIHDADAHFIEYDGWLEKYAKDFVKENLLPGLIPLDMSFLVPLMDAAKKRVAGGNPELTAELKANLFGHKAKLKQWPVFGAFNSAERSESLDILGLSSQLIFPTIGASRFARHNNPDVAYGGCDIAYRQRPKYARCLYEHRRRKRQRPEPYKHRKYQTERFKRFISLVRAQAYLHDL